MFVKSGGKNAACLAGIYVSHTSVRAPSPEYNALKIRWCYEYESKSEATRTARIRKAFS